MNYESLPTTKMPITLLLKGAPGTGKTWKAAHFPKPVFFNFDGNISGLQKLPPDIKNNLRFIDPRRKNGKELDGTLIFDNFVKQLEEVAADDSVKTIIIDSLTTLSEVLLDKVVGSSNPGTKVQIQHYGDFSRYLKWLAETFMCASDRDKHIVFIAHEQLTQDKLTQEVTYTLNLVSRMRDNFDLYFSDCWRCFVKVPTTGGVKYMVRVLPGSNFSAKCSLELPKEFDWDTDNTKVIEQL